MSDSLNQNMPFLKLIASIKKTSVRRAILLELSQNESFQKAMREIAKNTVRRKITLTAVQIRKLRKHKGLLKTLSSKKLSKRRKTTVISQSGGFLPILIPIIASLVGELIRSSD